MRSFVAFLRHWGGDKGGGVKLGEFGCFGFGLGGVNLLG